MRLYTEADAKADEARFAECDTDELVAQIGRMNIFAISGGRVLRHSNGISLPVSSGYWVTVHLDGNDTYVVRRIMKRGPKTWVKGELANVYADEVGEMAYQASSYKSYGFPKDCENCGCETS
jgi:hypothetical protein